MIFWDSSAVIPLLVKEPSTIKITRILAKDPKMIVWWATAVECCSAFARLRREGLFSPGDENALIELLSKLQDSWSEILAGDALRDIACRMLLKHPLRAADAMQLAAALVWAGNKPEQLQFICLDERLRDAAHQEGFAVLP